MATELRQEWASPAIRMLRTEDAGAVAGILRLSPQAVFWTEASVKEVLEWKGSLGMVIETAGRVAGFLIGRQTIEEAEVLNLAVAPGNRGKGTGGALLRAVVEEFQARGAKRVYLEVRESNEAGISFYEKHGFLPVGRREGYYREPIEAAVIMQKRFAE
jgi:[ribosomal protein S18]-alanine N-acetyltransferase